MNKKSNKEEVDFEESPTTRLNHILDEIDFPSGEGRINKLHKYLLEYGDESLQNIGYTSVRAWFRDSAPPMSKGKRVIDALAKDYTFNSDLSLLKTWWKAGGEHPPLLEIPVKINDKIMALVEEVAGEKFDDLKMKEVNDITDKTMQFSSEFSAPENKECPEEYLKMIIRGQLYSLIEES